MTFPRLRQVIPVAALLATGSLFLASCSTTEEDPAPASSTAPASETVPATTAGTAVAAEAEAEGPSVPVLSVAPSADLPAVSPAEEGDGSIDFGANPLTGAEAVDADADAISFQVEPAERLNTDSGMVTIHWAATAGGSPIVADDCVGMLSITGPEGETLTFEPGIEGCSGSTGILLRESVGAIPGDYQVQVSLDKASGEQSISVAAA